MGQTKICLADILKIKRGSIRIAHNIYSMLSTYVLNNTKISSVLRMVIFHTKLSYMYIYIEIIGYTIKVYA